MVDDTLKRFESAELTLGVIGLGYVGLPLAVEAARSGLRVLGFDVNEGVTRGINAGRTHIQDLTDADVAEQMRAGRLDATTDVSRLVECDAISICVPTPLSKTRDPDVSFILTATDSVAAALRPGQLVVLESTTYPGTTRELLQPALEKNGLKAGENFFLCFSPERVDPGNPTWKTRNTPKVIGGVTPHCTHVGQVFYERFIDTMVSVSSAEAAELTKILENTFRAVNIGLVNEITLMCRKMDINVWEVIDAAKTKPFGFMPFYPGPGLGGHCIPIDPFYLSWKARQSGFECRFIELAGQVNGAMPDYVVQRVADALNSVKKPLNGSRVHLFGVAYKRDVSDVRESPALDILEILVRRGASVSYTDPYVPRLTHGGRSYESISASGIDSHCDCAVVTTDHSAFNFERIAAMPLVVDTRNALTAFARPSVFTL